MKAIAITPGQKDSSHLQELDKPQAGTDELLVRVLETGVCGTDLEINTGLYGIPEAGYPFLVLGHENFGIVEEVGSNVSGWQKNDLIVCTVRRPCHEDDPNCQHGMSDMCLTGKYTERGIKERNGYMTEYYTEVPEFAIKIPDLYRHFGVLLEPTSVVEKAITQSYKIQERLYWEPKRAVVFGAGPIGLLGTFLLRNLGLEVYTAAHSLGGENNFKSQLVEKCGARYVSTQETPVEDFAKKFGQIDLIIEATGSSEVAFKALSVLGLNGVMALTSVSGGHNSLPLDTNILNMQMVLGNQVVFGSVNGNRRYFEDGVQHWGEFEQKYPGLLAQVITRRLPMEQHKTALSKDREGIKTVITITEN
jgi:threonine dehydrogenase-like Zn-dependent dehydrogenase